MPNANHDRLLSFYNFDITNCKLKLFIQKGAHIWGEWYTHSAALLNLLVNFCQIQWRNGQREWEKRRRSTKQVGQQKRAKNSILVNSRQVGVEPTTFCLGNRRSIHWATDAVAFNAVIANIYYIKSFLFFSSMQTSLWWFLKRISNIYLLDLFQNNFLTPHPLIIIFTPLDHLPFR